MITLAEKDMCPSEQSAQTVTYVVTGTSGAQVTYGPAGGDLSGTVPMSEPYLVIRTNRTLALVTADSP